LSILLAIVASFSEFSQGFTLTASLPKQTASATAPAFDAQRATSTASNHRYAIALYSSFISDGSDYSSKSGDYVDEEENAGPKRYVNYRDDEDETPTIELQPVPPSKNSGNRFVAVVWDRDLSSPEKDGLDMHYDRIQWTEDHVMYCRKANLYNETFNQESQVDVLWSLPM
jgi:hypothetical protein